MLDGLQKKLLGIRVGRAASVGSATVGIADPAGQRSGPAVEKLRARRERVGSKRIRSVSGTDALAEDRDARAFIRAHQGWLDQLFRQVSVERGIPSHGGFERQPVDRELHVRRAAG